MKRPPRTFTVTIPAEVVDEAEAGLGHRIDGDTVSCSPELLTMLARMLVGMDRSVREGTGRPSNVVDFRTRLGVARQRPPDASQAVL